MRILVGTDGSSGADEAMNWLATFPLPGNAAVEVITASRLPFAAEAVAAMGWQQLLAESQRVADAARERLAKRWPTVIARTLDGDPRDAIVAAAKQSKADLIVLGARGLGAVASFVLGSVSLGVTRDAPAACSSAMGEHDPCAVSSSRTMGRRTLVPPWISPLACRLRTSPCASSASSSRCPTRSPRPRSSSQS